MEMESVLKNLNFSIKFMTSLLMDSYIADAPSNSALFAGGGSLIRLALDAQVHDVITANSAVIHNDI